MDCTDIELFTGRVTEAGSGAIGVMFTVRSDRDVRVTALEYFSNAAGLERVEVYSREGNHGGLEFTEGAWTLEYDRTVSLTSGLSDPNLLDDLNVLVRANTDRSFYLYSPSLVRYENTSGQTISMDDGIVQILDGTGVNSQKWSGNSASNLFQPRAFRGSLL